MSGAIAGIDRGCGRRVAGGVYFETGLAPAGEGLPLEAFIKDPPIPVDVKALGLSTIGVKLVESEGAWHVMDWVGEQHYPNVADFLEEVRRYGLSRRLHRTLDYGKLTEESRIVLVHRRAYVDNAEEYLRPAEGEWTACPKGLAQHEVGEKSTPAMCAGVWWNDIEGGGEISPPAGSPDMHARRVLRKMPWGGYYGQRAPRGVEPQYRPAIFAVFPLSRLVVVKDEGGGSHEGPLEKLRKAGHDATLVDE